MFGIFEKKKVIEVAVDLPEQGPRKIVACPPFGDRIGELTRFGKTWINLNEVSVIEFQPPDGCGCEVMFKNNKTEWHISEEDALAIKTYLENLAALG